MTNLNTLIDQYAVLKTQLGKLEAEKKALEKALASVPAGAYESDNYRLTISDAVLESYDDVIKAEIKLVTDGLINGMSRQYLTAHTVSKPSRRHLVGLPTGKNLAA
jgi:hypothetical protein